jgi:cytochrome P450
MATADVDQARVTGYEAVRAGLVDPRLSADRMLTFADDAPAEAVAELRRRVPWLVTESDSDFDWIRPVFHAGIADAVGEPAQAAMRVIADDLLDAALARPAFDAAADYAFPFAGQVLAHLLGMPRRDAAPLMRWSMDLVEFFNSPVIARAPVGRLVRSAAEMVDHVRALLDAGDVAPGEGFLGRTVDAASGHGHAVDDFAVGNVVLPFLTGQAAVAHLIGSAILLVLRHPDARERLRADPELVAALVEETLRLDAPVVLVPRIAVQPLELDGRTIARGQTLHLDVAAANRDPRRFPDPDRCDLGRPPQAALAFGHGPHSCLGARLSRLQARIALAALLRRAPGLELDAAGDVVWCPFHAVHGPDAIAVRHGAAAV